MPGPLPGEGFLLQLRGIITQYGAFAHHIFGIRVAEQRHGRAAGKPARDIEQRHLQRFLKSLSAGQGTRDIADALPDHGAQRLIRLQRQRRVIGGKHRFSPAAAIAGTHGEECMLPGIPGAEAEMPHFVGIHPVQLHRVNARGDGFQYLVQWEHGIDFEHGFLLY